MKFKFNVGQFVHYKRHPDIKFFVVERHRQECYSALQDSYVVREITTFKGKDNMLRQVSKDLMKVLEVEIEAD